MDHHRQTSGAILKQAVRDAALHAYRGEAGRSDRFVICITSFRKKLLDTDNLCSKWFTDALRYAAILPGDSPDEAFIFTTQEKVADESEERTEIEITKLPAK